MLRLLPVKKSGAEPELVNGSDIVFRSGCSFGMLLFGLVATIVGLRLTILVVDGYYYGQQSRNWPTTEGTITSSRVAHEMFPSTSRRRAHDHTYTPSVWYSFRVGDEKFSGDRIIWPPWTHADDRKAAEAVVSKYPEGSTVPVYYDPTNPKRCVLQPGFSWADNTWALVIVFLCVLFGSFGLWIASLTASYLVQGLKSLGKTRDEPESPSSSP